MNTTNAPHIFNRFAILLDERLCMRELVSVGKAGGEEAIR